jgi:hypothetical protein
MHEVPKSMNSQFKGMTLGTVWSKFQTSSKVMNFPQQELTIHNNGS